MFKKLFNFIFFNEKREFIQKNALMMTYIGCLQLIITITDIFRGRYQSIIADIPVLSIMFIGWILLKKYKYYPSHLAFFTAVPALSWLLYDSVEHNGMLGIIWSFPMIAILFFCFYKYLAWLSAGIIFTVSFLSSWKFFGLAEALRISSALIMVAFCFFAIFSNVYKQYTILENKAITDHMTGLFNRSYLQECLLKSIENNSHSVAMMLDLDHFKYINDTFGHFVGDEVLIELAQVFRDYAGSDDAIFRLGGEEFLIIMNNTSLEQAKILAENIRSTIESQQLIEDHVVTISIGLSVHKKGDSYSQWLKNADYAVYKAKKCGRNKVVVN